MGADRHHAGRAAGADDAVRVHAAADVAALAGWGNARDSPRANCESTDFTDDTDFLFRVRTRACKSRRRKHALALTRSPSVFRARSHNPLGGLPANNPIELS